MYLFMICSYACSGDFLNSVVLASMYSICKQRCSSYLEHWIHSCNSSFKNLHGSFSAD